MLNVYFFDFKSSIDKKYENNDFSLSNYYIKFNNSNIAFDHKFFIFKSDKNKNDK